jgi:hypothetical protein
MSQTSIIFGALLVGFIVYVTAKGQLPAYFAVLGLGTSTTPPATTTS